LDELGLNASIEWQCKEFTRIDGIPCVFEQLCDDEGLSLAVKTELFRICQEALTNIMRHAHATEVIVTIQKKYGSKQLTIADNGIGFDISKKKNTLGLIGMRERALSVNGELTVKSEPGKGTIVSVAVPKIIYPI
jgi:signal transduction histidine kinase